MRSTSQRGLLVIGFAAAAASLYACNSTDSVSAPVRQAPAHHPVFAGQASPDIQRRVAEAQRKYAWVADLHTDAVRAYVKERKRWPNQGRGDKARQCELAFKLTRDLIPSANERIGRRRGGLTEHASIAQQAFASTSCAASLGNAKTMSIFGAVTSAPLASMLAPQEVTGSYIPYVDQMRRDFDAAANNLGSVYDALNNSVVAAASIGDNDFAMVVAAADFMFSSTLEWDAVYPAGGSGGGGGGPDDPAMTMIFRLQWGRSGLYDWYTHYLSDHGRRVARNDAIGCAAGALTGGGPWGCAVWGAAGSLAT